MKKIYVACSLTHAPENFKLQIDHLKKELKKHFEVLDFYGLTAGQPKDIYEHDVSCVKNCDLLLAEVSYPALGVGFEIATALANKKPVFAVANSDAHVSRLIIGIQDPLFTFFKYSTLPEVVLLLKNHIE